eukprot:TRINITY_DN4314_c0_g1_i6.p1 TRINITY_DN4314_c0_g1~~TRINITY_DN4314_c0_g1_i6.p1  ORF type:complete len:793 (-),score=68.90 TRINITY_DN4314_c0_g1_i6:299-2455(-)
MATSNHDDISYQFLAKKLVQYPSIENAQVFPLSQKDSKFTTQFQVILKQPDYIKNKTIRHTRSYVLDDELQDVVEQGMGPPLGGYAAYYYSPSGDKAVGFKEPNGGKEGNETQIIELIVDGGIVAQQITVPDAVHGPVCHDQTFGQISWDEKENRIVYVAQIPKPKTDKLLGNSDEADKAGEKGWKGVAEFKEDWGELLGGKTESGLFILHIEDGSIARFGEKLEGSLGQPVFAPKDEGIVFVQWPSSFVPLIPLEMKLGLIYCANRPTKMFYLSFDKEAEPECLSSSLKNATHPRFSPEGDKLVFLSNDRACASGTHLSAVKLMCMHWNENRKEAKTIISDTQNSDEFCGLFCLGMNLKPFIDNNTVILTTQLRCDSAIISVELESGKITRISPKNKSFALLRISKSGHICASSSTPVQLDQLAIAKLPQLQESVENWQYFDLATQKFNELDSLKYEVVTLDTENHPIQVIIVYKQGTKGGKGVLNIHGGPHSANSTEFRRNTAFLAIQGYCVAYVNYRGSWGYGAESLESLPGHIGTNDVQDCMQALKWLISNGYINENECCVMGGSHGGFLTGHLMGQHSDAFRCGILLNPVCDLSLMIHVTDIPDWCYTEAFGVGTQMRYPPSKEDYARLFEVSPIAHVDNVKKPVFYLLGKADRRVPWVDGQRYIQVLKARGNLQPDEIKVVVYDEDSHPLDKVKTSMQVIIDIYNWLEIHCS